MQPLAGHHEMDALRRAHADLAAAGEILHLVGPDAGRVQELAPAHDEGLARLEADRARADDAFALAQQADHAHAGGERGPVERRRAREREGVTRVVDLRVPVEEAADQRVAPKARCELEAGAPGEVAVARQAAEGLAAAARGEGVVERDAGSDVGALHHPVTERVEEAHRAHEVGAQAAEEQRALRERLAHQAEVPLLQVAEPAVDQLARAARSARREVALLDQRDREASRRRIHGAARAGDAASDDDDVEDLLGHPGEGGAARVGAEAGAVHGWSGNIAPRGQGAMLPSR